MPDVQKAYRAREKRIYDAIDLKEPDRVPIIAPRTNTFPYHYCGYTMAEVIYDIEKAKEAVRRFHVDFDLDSGNGIGTCREGQGLILEKLQPKDYMWAGMPNGLLDNNSIHQFIEFPLIEDDEFDVLAKDRTGLLLNKILPRQCGIMEPFASFDFNSIYYPNPGVSALAIACATTKFRSMFENLAELGEMLVEYAKQSKAFAAEIDALGYPQMCAGAAIVSFDSYSDFLRGTFAASMDIYDRPEVVKEFINTLTKLNVAKIQASPTPGRMIFIPMHKGMDGFLSDKQYAEFYWPHLLELVEGIITAGMIPYVYTEGPYYSRLKFLQQLPVGKCVVHFEGMDMAVAKRELGDVACLSGNFPAQFLLNATKQQVVDKVKGLLDVCAPGGGYIFDLDGGLYFYPPANVEAMYETVKECGKY